MNNAEDFPRGTKMDPMNHQGQETDPSNINSYTEEGGSMATGGESFLLEGDHSQDLIDNQRTSTPTKTFTHFTEDGAVLDGSTQGSALSPVLWTDAENTTPIDDQSSLSPGRNSTQENSGEESWSLYTSALSNVNTTLTSDSYSAAKDQAVESSALQVSMPVDILCQGSLGDFSSQDNTWATARGSFQDNSDLKDVTIKQEFNHSNFSSNVDDSKTEDHSESTYGEIQDSQDVGNSDTEDVMTETGRDVISVEVPPDLDLLNEICEEATNMTIKEALICSLNPGVRAGLREGRLSLNESEILALEQYCEQFIDNLISQLLDGQWSERISEETSKPKPLEDKAKVAQKLSKLGLETLKSNCDRFVHSIITESLHDSCFRFQSKSTKSPERDTELNVKQMPNVALDQYSVEILLPLFKESDAIQDYIGFLAADIIKSALANLSTAMATKNGDKNDHMMLNKNSTSDDKTSTEIILFPSKQKTETQLDTIPGNDMWKYESDHLRNEARRVKRSSLSSDENFEGQHVRETEGLSDDEHMFSSSLNGALETSLEFDIGDCWEGGGLLEDLNSLDAERKQKIVLRELSFDEHADVAGTELLAPVFLAIADENDDDTEFQGLRKKAQSIENLCGVIDEHVDEKYRQRSYSAPKRIRPLHQTAQVHFIHPEQDSDEMKANEKRYEEDDFENEIVDEEEWDGDKDKEDKEKEEDQNGYAQDEEEQDNEGQGEKFGQDGQRHDKAEVSSDDGRFRWHTVSVNGRDKILDLKLLEPYMKVISHGGYFSDTKATIVVIAACYLPNRSIRNYDFLMEQLFFYVISTLELLAIHEEYYLVYLNGGTRQQNTPSVTWMKRFYQCIEGGLKKRMKEMFIVHPSFRLKAVITLAKPFLNASFWRKLSFVHSLSSLSSHVPVDYIYIPDEVMRVDPAYRQVHSQ